MTRIDAAIRHLIAALEHLYRLEDEGEADLDLSQCCNKINRAIHKTSIYAKDNHERINESGSVQGGEPAQADAERRGDGPSVYL